MKKLYSILFVLMLALMVGTINAQTVSPVDFMRYNPYQMNANPATDLPYESVMAFFLGNIGLDIQNTTLRYDNLFEFDAQGRPSTVNLRQFANSLKEDNFLGINTNIELFTLYRRLKKGMLTFDYGIRIQGDATFNDGLFKLLGYGNGAFVGNDHPATLNLDLNLNAYHEFAAGYQINVTERLSLGWKTKLIFGLANVTTDAFNAQLFTDADSYALRIKENIAMKAALPRALSVDETGDFVADALFSVGDLFSNPGFGFDLAAEYRFNEHFSAVAAIHDLGFIHWGLNNIGMTGNIQDEGQYYDNGDFLFNGVGVDQLQLIASDDYYRERFLDSLRQYFQLEFAPMDKYNTPLNTNLLLRANYDINPCHRFSAQVQGYFMGSGMRPAVTVAYCGSFFNNLNVCATYTAMPHSYDNIGLGFSWMMGTCNVYLTTNNVLGFFKPLNTSATNAQVGIVFNLWTPERRYVKPAKQTEN